jgi:hypothetical protein
LFELSECSYYLDNYESEEYENVLVTSILIPPVNASDNK